MTVLLLAGTREAREIARGLLDADIASIASLAGATRDPTLLSIPTRIGGFGSAQGFAEFLQNKRISAVIDATHPFAHHMSTRSAEVCASHAIPYAQVLRPAWTANTGWLELAREEDAAAHISEGQTVFLATGRQTLDKFANLAHARVICRQIDPPDRPFPFPNGQYHIAKPPFSLADEVALFKTLGVDWLIAKNAGGTASRSKLDAADALGIRVALLARPPQPPGPKLAGAAEALDWVRAL